MTIFYQVTKSMSTAALPPGADAVERGADDRPLRMGCAVPRMHRPQSAGRPADAPVCGWHGRMDTARQRAESAPSDAAHVIQ